MTFSEWIVFVFDHPVSEPVWCWDSDDEEIWPELEEHITVAYLTQLFTNADSVTQPFSDAQVSQGLRFLVNPSCSDYIFALKDKKVPLADRLGCIASMGTLFEKCFAVRCSASLSHLDEPNTNPLNSICYMWWDVLPIHGLIEHIPERSDSIAIDQACLGVIQGLLESDALPCIESGLHGLGEWIIYYPSIQTIIEDFLHRHPMISPELRAYAERAAVGHV